MIKKIKNLKNLNKNHINKNKNLKVKKNIYNLDNLKINNFFFHI
jgi:hypothetical protein